MGQAKLRRDEEVHLVWHHTSTLRTNLIWMSGVIEVEGQEPAVQHPQLGLIQTGAHRRRAMVDFPPLAWFTRSIRTPGTLLSAKMIFMDKDSGEEVARMGNEAVANALALQRLALAFDLRKTPLVHWPEHPGSRTAEGIELNETAIESGDDPQDWYVSERPVQVLQAVDVRVSRSIMKPKLERLPAYLAEIHKMVTLCRYMPSAYIPLSWMKPENVKRAVRDLGLPSRGYPERASKIAERSAYVPACPTFRSSSPCPT